MPLIYLRPITDYYTAIEKIIPTDPATHFDKVDEEVANDADNVYRDTGYGLPPYERYDLYYLTPGLMAAGSFINYVKLCFRAYGKHPYGPQYAAFGAALKTHDVVYSSHPFESAVNGVYEDQYIQYDKNPFTDDFWTPEEIDALLAGPALQCADTVWAVRCSQFYVEVSFTGMILLSGTILMPHFEVGSKQVTLRAEITGGTGTGTAWFEYGLTTEYGSETAHQYPVFRDDFLSFISHNCELERNVLYHYRFVLKTADEYWYGDDQVIRIDDKILYRLGILV